MEDMQSSFDDKDVETRRKGVEMLRNRPSDEAVPVLLKAMEDRNWRVRKTAAEILVSDHPMDRYIGGLFELLSLEEDAGARNSAIETLTRLGKAATPHLMKAFETPNKDVRKFIIDIIGVIKDRTALPLLLASLKDEDENVRASAVEYLGDLAEPAIVDELVTILREGEVWTAFPAADALGRIGDRRAVPALVAALSVRALREPVLKSLGRLSDEATLDHVVPLLMDKSRVIQEEALKAVGMFYHNGVPAESISKALWRLCGADCITVLISHAWSRKRDVRASAVLLLGVMQDQRVLVPLIELSSEEDLAEDVKNALVFVGKNRPEFLLPLFETDNPQRRRFIEEVASLVASPLYYIYFERDLSDPDGHVRAFAAAGLANIGDEKAIVPLKKILTDPYEDVQEAAVKALTRFQSSLGSGEFVVFLRSEEASLRKNAALILGQLAEKETVAALGFALKDVEVPVRSAVVRALSAIPGEESVRHLMFALTDESPKIRVSAALSLGGLGGEGVLESLVILTRDSHDAVRAASARALGMKGDDRALESLIGLLPDRNGFVVTAAIEAIGRIGGPRAKTALLGMLGSADAEIRRTAIRSLTFFEDVDSALLPCLRDPDWAARTAAVEALSRNATGSVRAEVERLFDAEEDPAVRRAIEECFFQKDRGRGPASGTGSGNVS
jgi:HEAT repeat protein